MSRIEWQVPTAVSMYFQLFIVCTCSTINFLLPPLLLLPLLLLQLSETWASEQDRVAGPDCSLHPRRMFPVCPVISSSQVLPPTQMNIKLQNTKVQCIENTIRLKALNQANTVLILVQLNCSIPVTLTDVGVCSPIHQIIWKHRRPVKIWLQNQNS